MNSFRFSTAANRDIAEIGNYLVFYTTAPGGIDVVRVIYGGRNLPVAFVSP